MLFSEQKNIIDMMISIRNYIEENSNIRAKYAQYRYTIDDLYLSEWSPGKETGIFAIKDHISTLENPKNFYPEVWKQFQESDTGAAYRA